MNQVAGRRRGRPSGRGGSGLLALCLILPAGAQTILVAASRPAPTLSGPDRLIREIDDPHLGTRWLLLRDAGHPAGPGRLVPFFPQARPSFQRGNDRASGDQGWAVPMPVIRAGDRLVLEESSPVVEAHLEAVALGPAAVGSILEVRLGIGGHVLRAVALAPGRVALAPSSEVQQ